MAAPVEGSRAIVGVAIVSELALGLIALAAGWVCGHPPLAQIQASPLGLVQGLLATVPLAAAFWVAHVWPIGPLRGLKDIVGRLVVPMFRGCTLADLALISIAAGLGEELLFRGVLQSGIAGYTGSAWTAVAIAAAIFGLAHPISRTYVVLAAAIGVYLGWLLVATGNLLVPIVTHAAYDFVALVVFAAR